MSRSACWDATTPSSRRTWSGLNHEMARQLLWAGYPTDCMGSYFRQFWDVSGYVPPARRPGRPRRAGRAAQGHPADQHLAAGRAARHAREPRRDRRPTTSCCSIRGELLRRYPDTIIYAAKARLAGTPGSSTPATSGTRSSAGHCPPTSRSSGSTSAPRTRRAAPPPRPRGSSSSSSSTRPGPGSAWSHRPPAGDAMGRPGLDQLRRAAGTAGAGILPFRDRSRQRLPARHHRAVLALAAALDDHAHGARPG